MTPEQREAAVNAAAHAMWDDDHRGPGFVPAIPPDERDETAMECYRDYARATLAALTDAGFVVLHGDDVIERFGSNNAGERSRRLVTRWEPITKEDVGPWTTQETP